MTATKLKIGHSETYPSEYAAKFAREKKDNPTHWVIHFVQHRLVYIGPERRQKSRG